MGFYNIDWRFLVWTYLATRYRLTAWRAWLAALISPVSDFIDPAFQAFRTQQLYFLNHTSQVCYMEAVLNDAFDNNLRRITISDPVYTDPVYVFQDSEDRPVFVWQDSEVTGGTPNAAAVYVYQDGEYYSGGGEEFIVHVPSAVYATWGAAAIQAQVNRYRLPSKNNYTIVTF